MTEEIIKECKNCDALGIDSEMGVYYCCLSHRQDDLPKEFTCNDFTPNKQLKRLEQENKELKKQIESQKGLITVGGKQQYEMTMAYDRYKSALEEIREIIRADCKRCTAECDCDDDCTRYKIQNKINEVLE